MDQAQGIPPNRKKKRKAPALFLPDSTNGGRRRKIRGRMLREGGRRPSAVGRAKGQWRAGSRARRLTLPSKFRDEVRVRRGRAAEEGNIRIFILFFWWKLLISVSLYFC